MIPALALISILAVGSALPSWPHLSAAERDRILKAQAGTSLSSRLLANSERFLGVRYGFSPLGEGSGIDPDPRLRFDLVDCQTLVEETIALSLARRDEDVAAVLDQLRYARRPVYEERNHLMEAQWLPANIAKGFVRDVTAKIAGPDLVQAFKTITHQTWRSSSSRALALPARRQVRGVFPLPMLPIDKLAPRARRIPSGTLMLIVREDRPLKVTRVSHLGFVVQKPKGTYFRHAARSLYGRVVDETIDEFLARNAAYQRWKVVGVSFYRVVEPKALLAVH